MVEEQADYDSFPSPVATTARLSGFSEQKPSRSQTQPKTATTQAQPVTSTPVKPADPQKQAPAQAQKQARAQAQIWPLTPAQPPRPAAAFFPQPQATPPRGATRMPSESLLDEDRLLDFPESEASLIAKQAQSELLDRVANLGFIRERGS